MRLFIDTNIILDIALKREPFYKDSASVFKKIDNKNLKFRSSKTNRKSNF